MRRSGRFAPPLRLRRVRAAEAHRRLEGRESTGERLLDPWAV